MRLIVSLILLLGACQASFGQLEVQEPKAKAFAKQVSKLSKTLTQKSMVTSIILGYKKFETTETTSFYNKASESLFYVLLCKDSSTIHYQIPLQSVSPCSDESASKPRPKWCVDMANQMPAYMVIYNKAGAMIYNQSYTKLTLPVGSIAVARNLHKHSVRLVELRQQ